MYLVTVFSDDECGYSVSHKVFNSYIEAERYAEEQIELAESEFGTSVDREENVYAVVKNSYEEWKGFVEISELILPSEEH